MGSPSTTVDSLTGATSSDATDQASEIDMEPACFNATTTWPVSRKSVGCCEVTGDESDSEMSPMPPRRQNKGLAPTLLQSAFRERGTQKSVCVKNTFIVFVENPT